LDGQTIFIVILVAVIVLVVVFVGVPAVKLFVGLPDYDLYLDAKIDTQNSVRIGQVLIKNTGSQPLSNIQVDFGKGDILEVGTLDPRDKLILTPPNDNKMEFVTVSADQDILVSVAYRDSD